MTPIGSRRIEEVWSAEYSAVALPSRLRAAPEKKSMLSMVPGTSNSRVSRIGLPACRLSSWANSSARLLQDAREAGQHCGAFSRGGPGPGVVGLGGGLHGLLDLVATGEADRLDDRAVGRVDHVRGGSDGAGGQQLFR